MEHKLWYVSVQEWDYLMAHLRVLVMGALNEYVVGVWRTSLKDSLIEHQVREKVLERAYL